MRLAIVPDPVAAKVAAHMESPQALLQTQSQHLPATCAEKRRRVESAVEVSHLEAIHCSQMQVRRLDALLLERDFLIWPRGRKLASANLGRYSALEVLGKTHDELVNSPC